MQRNRKVLKNVSVQCNINSNKYVRESEKKLIEAKKFYFREIKTIKKKMGQIESEKNVISNEEKKFVSKIQVRVTMQL